MIRSKQNSYKKQVHILIEAIDASQAKIVSCRYCKSSGEVSVSISNIMDNIIVLNNRNRISSTFEIRDYEIPQQSKTETFYYKYCKYALGILKYSSKVLTLGELERYPILIKSIVLGILYWWRLEMGTKNPLLNRVYNTMKEEYHEWLQNIHFVIQNRHG